MSISLAPCSTAISISLRRVSSGVWPCKRRSQSCRYRAKHLPHPAASIHSTLCFFREDLFYIHGLTVTKINTEANLKLFSVWLQLATVATHMRTHTGETMFAWIKCDYKGAAEKMLLGVIRHIWWHIKGWKTIHMPEVHEESILQDIWNPTGVKSKE